MSLDPYVLVRAGSLYGTALFTLLAWIVSGRSQRRSHLIGALLAFCWNLPTLLVLNVVAVRVSWWHFDATGGLLLGVPLDLLLCWAWLWSGVTTLALGRAPLWMLIGAAVAFDVLLMPYLSPVLILHDRWLVGEAIALLAILIPGQLLARWTIRGEHLTARAVLQAITFSGLVLFILPAIAIENTGGHWMNPVDRPNWQISLIVQLLAVPATVGLSALQEFAQRGGGTPVPFDPPTRLVTTGLYAYVRNPMQLSAVLLLGVLGIVLQNLWVSAAGVMAHIYSAGLAGWDEDGDLQKRFGGDWNQYRRNVGRWLPRVRPWHRDDLPPARLYVAASCEMCSEVAMWFRTRGAVHLDILAAETHPSAALTRITYEHGDGSRPASGIEAIARAFEHLHIGWALFGACLRLPGILQSVQLLVDACGGGPRQIQFSENL